MTDRIKLIGIDLDGTFLKDDKTLCDGAADTIRRAAEAGICTVPITGRPFSGIPQCIRDIDEIKYVICSNGSEIIDFKSGKSIYSSTLDNETVNKILAVLNQRGCLYEVFADGYGYIDEAVYGLCEINREKVKQARIVANPGCYPTCSTLSIYPLLKEDLIDGNTIIIDAKSGTSGAGRGAKVDNLYCEVNENIKAYGVAGHRHTPEIEEQLGYAAGEPVLINFTPHLVPMNRGILATEYATLIKKPDGTYPSYEELKAAYDKYYAQ